MTKHLLGIVAIVGVLSAARVASASYICDAVYIPGASQLGSHGYVYFSAYAGPNCTGAFQGTAYQCSTGATDPSCASDPLFRASNDQELAIIGEGVRAAADSQQVVEVMRGSCIGFGSTCLTMIFFRGL